MSWLSGTRKKRATDEHPLMWRVESRVAGNFEELGLLPLTDGAKKAPLLTVNSKTFEAKKINATVVLRWDGMPKDEEKEVVIRNARQTSAFRLGKDSAVH